MHSRKLKIEDALLYVNHVKQRLQFQPEMYNEFMDTMKSFRAGSINTLGVIQRISILFQGHPELIEGFNTFLPVAYQIQYQPTGQAHNGREPSDELCWLLGSDHRKSSPWKEDEL